MVGGRFRSGICCPDWFCNSRYERIDHFWKNGTIAHASRGDVASCGMARRVAFCFGSRHSCSAHCCNRRLCRSSIAICGNFIWTMGCLVDVRHIALDGALVAHVGGSRRHRRRIVRRIDGSRTPCTVAEMVRMFGVADGDSYCFRTVSSCNSSIGCSYFYCGQCCARHASEMGYPVGGCHSSSCCVWHCSQSSVGWYIHSFGLVGSNHRGTR